MLMLDIKIVASKTRDRLSLGKSQAMLAVVQDELARHYEDENSYKYIDNGQFVFLFESDTLQQTRLLAQELVVKVPELIAHLSDIELLSHASFLQLPGGSELSAGAILAHCTAACLKVEKDGMDNKIFEINSQKLTNCQQNHATNLYRFFSLSFCCLSCSRATRTSASFCFSLSTTSAGACLSLC